MVRLCSLPHCNQDFPCRAISSVTCCVGSSPVHLSVCSVLYDFYWHTAQEGFPIPLGVFRSSHLHGNNTTGFILLVFLSLMMLYFILAQTSFSYTHSVGHQVIKYFNRVLQTGSCINSQLKLRVRFHCTTHTLYRCKNKLSRAASLFALHSQI